MEQQTSFNSWSFFSGVMTGLIIRATDILPLLGGFLLGLTAANLPDMIQIQHFPVILQQVCQKVKNGLNFTQLSNNQTRPQPKLKNTDNKE